MNFSKDKIIVRFKYRVFIKFILISFINIKITFSQSFRERASINQGWRFFKYTLIKDADSLIYDIRPPIIDKKDDKDADSKPTEAKKIEVNNQLILKPWVLPTANKFICDITKHHKRPDGNPGADFKFVKADFDDNSWEQVDLPHDWAIKGPFMEGWDAEIGGGMGRLPSPGVAWYRKKIYISENDKGKQIFLEIDGAMSYAIVWVNGYLAGGWPYGYASWSIDITSFLKYGCENQIAIRLDNPNHSSRWYPGGGIYRNVWLTKVYPVYVDKWGTFVKTIKIDTNYANLEIDVNICNTFKNDVVVTLIHEIYEYNDKGIYKNAINKIKIKNLKIFADSVTFHRCNLSIKKPKLWNPLPQISNLYILRSKILINNKIVDSYDTRFGIRTIELDPNNGICINGKLVKIKGVNLHHDLGALGAAFNLRAAERQLELLREMGCNSIRFAHNPPAPEFLELTDKMGFLVIDEIFDCWQMKKTPHDFHLIFDDWYEADLRAFIRRDRNCPSVIIWSFGNEVGEQYTGSSGAEVAKKLYKIIKEEDPIRPTTIAMNFAKPYMELPKIPDVIGLNYQGEGIRQDPEFEGTDRIRTPPQYNAFHEKFPYKVIISTETASALSTRGTYLFPVVQSNSSFIRDGRGGDSKNMYVSAYELYAVDFGSSPDKVFASLDKHPYVAGEFVWTGWDYLGEPTPYYLARSSYSGIIDLAGFKKDRFYLYQSRWRPELPLVHIIPHWNWPERIGQITPIHVFTSGDEAELFINGKSMGKKKKGQYEYRLRWDSVVYEPGQVYVIAYKNGKKWAESLVETTSSPVKLVSEVDRTYIKRDGNDLAFVTIKIVDEKERVVPTANNEIEFSIEGEGEILATDNGDPTDMTSFKSLQRKAFNGLCLAIVKFKKHAGKEKILLKANSKGLQSVTVEIYPIE